MYIAVILFFISLTIYMSLYYKINTKIVFSLKVITSLLFLILGFIAFSKNKQAPENYAVLIIVALFCGLFGDVILGLRGIDPYRKNEYLVLGLIMFLLGHIIYSISFYQFNTKGYLVYLIVAILITSIILLTVKIAKLNFGIAKWFSYGYIFISSFVLSLTIINFIYDAIYFNVMLFLGAFLFVLSDYILCFIYFKKLKNKNLKILKRINIITYYLAQFIFALSIYYIK